MTLDQLPDGARFRTPGRRRVLTKVGNGRGSHPLAKEIFPGSALHIVHDDRGEIIFVPHHEVRNSSGRKWDMKSDVEVIQVF